MLTPRRSCLAVIAAATALAMIGVAAPAAAQTFKAELTGAAILPDPIKTPATGQLELTIAANGQSISYVLTVKDIENVTEADMHLGPAIANGPLVVKLFRGAAKKGPVNGVLAEGKIDAADLIGPMAGAKLSELIEEIKAGNAYVNVHTSDGTDPPSSGPGDYRLGEIRGQIK